MHVSLPKGKEMPHPLYSTLGRKHYEQQLSNTNEWKSTIKNFPNKDDPRPEKYTIIITNYFI
jgi:hypothetical protein